ncbi:hypothetical protein HO133_000663 [Letharia lupina]|uniref:RNase H type-1 domain-containing protein n=1 Tax=Letharia lupina TaxID=560253 RepID=A0A8H6CG67_9LECA|nr:uncharacterized protein HO133_000663 [Letharia lupina]KAF6222616.1 hypothetical protein HO133_000663 [Letharia lupina]
MRRCPLSSNIPDKEWPAPEHLDVKAHDRLDETREGIPVQTRIPERTQEVLIPPMAIVTPSMSENSITPLPSDSAHQAPPQTKTSPSPPQHLSTQCNGMERTTSPIRSSSPHSPTSIGFVLSAPPFSPSIYPSYLLPYLVPIPPPLRKGKDATKRTVRRFAKRLLRLEACLAPSMIVARAQRRFEQEQMKRSESDLFEEACMKSELKRAKRTDVFPETFQTIDIHNDGQEDEDSACEQIIITQASEIGAETRTTKTEAFAGLIIIQHRLSAMSQALSEHAKDGMLRTEPGRHSFHVDAAVSSDNGLTGIAVVHKTHRQYWASLWTAKGYRIREALDQEDAETWAIWQALQVTLEKVHADRAQVKPQDPCSLAVVYSDCAVALVKIGKGRSDGRKVVQKIIDQSMELQRLGVEVQLHWVPGHVNIPGNELADLVAKKARQPVK